MQLISDIARRNGNFFSGKPGVIQGNLRLSYEDINMRANRLGHALRRCGVKKGDRVALLSRNDYRFLEMYFGLPKIGALFVPLNFWAAAAELLAMLEQCETGVLIFSEPLRELVDSIRSQLHGMCQFIFLGDDPPWWASAYERLLSDNPVEEPRTVLLPDDDTLILYTSGSTGKPKGAVYTHTALIHTAAVMRAELALRETDVTLQFLPMFSSNLEHLLPLSFVGATHVILEKFDPSVVWETVSAQKITHFDAVPTTLRMLLDAPPSEDCDLSSLRLVSYASETMPAATITAWLRRFPQVEAVQFYGMIECLCVSVQKPWEQISRMGSVGRAMTGTEIRIVDERGRQLPPGSEGEITCRTACACRGYWQAPQLTGALLRDGWVRTGDIGILDSDGYLTLVGRKKEIIISGGMKVVPAETEEVVYRHPAVSEVAVLGLPDQEWGEVVHAVVVLRPGAAVSSEELQSFCRDHIAGYKVPRSIEFVSALPKTGIGKVARQSLRSRRSVDSDRKGELREEIAHSDSNISQ